MSSGKRGAVDGLWHYRSGARTPLHTALRWVGAAVLACVGLVGAVVAAADWMSR